MKQSKFYEHNPISGKVTGKLKIVNSYSFYYSELAYGNEEIHPSLDIPAYTPAYFMQNPSDLTLQVIGSCKTQFIPPVIILQSRKLVPFIADYFWTLYIPMHTSSLGILHHLVSLESILLY